MEWGDIILSAMGFMMYTAKYFWVVVLETQLNFLILIVVNYIYPIKLKSNYSASAKDNKNWFQDIDGTFTDNYWKSVLLEIETLGVINEWEVIDLE